MNKSSEANWYAIVGVAVVIALIGGLTGFGIGVWQAPNLRSPGPDPKIEFLRGTYMTCVSFIEEVFSAPPADAMQFCNNKLIARVIEEKWYEKSDSGFIAPTAVPTTPPK